MASVRDIKITEALLILYIAYYVFDIAEIEVLWSTYRDMGHTFREYIFRIFGNGWMDCRCFSFAYDAM